MKHRVLLACACVCACLCAAALCGCQSKEYEPADLKPTVSSPVIGEDGVLRVGVNSASAPFAAESENQDGQLVGIDADVAAAIASELGLKLQLVDVAEAGEDALVNGEVDVVMGKTVEDASDAMWVTTPYIESGIVLFGAPDATIPQPGETPVIAAQTSSMSAWAASQVFGDEAMKSSSDLLSAFSEVETGSASFVASDAVIGTYAALHQNLDVAPVAVFGSLDGYCMAVSADNVELQTAVADALDKVSGNGVLSVIAKKWLGTALDLASLPVIEGVSAPAEDPSTEDGQSVDDGAADGETSVDGEIVNGVDSADEDDSSVDTNGSTAGANAVLPGQV